jgi:hypothetical protein
MSLPLEDAKSLELSSIRVSDNQLYVVIKDVNGNQKWILANELFDLKDITLWEFFTNEDTAEFKPKETFAYKEFPDKKDVKKVFIKNPLPITITLTPKTITIYLQDYGTVYKTEETWVNLDKRDRYKTFTDLWISLKNKLAKELGIEDYSYFDRLTEEIDDKFIEYYIRQEFRVLMAQLDYLGYLICQNLPKIPETPETPEPKFNIGDKVIRKGSQQVMTVIKRIYDGDEESFDYDLKFEDDSYESYFENELEPYEATPKDCESDASLIVSGQVKKFYDLNKPRIEKLKTEFSCKIVKALVYLSEYEKCGKPSKIKLPKPKDDLLSEIKNLKF